MVEQRQLRPNAAERLGILWCRLKHAAPMWPIHGRYTCRICGRSYRVPWAGEHVAEPGPFGIQQAARIVESGV